ncbi:hypothetical protein Tco_1499514 [Tanacetum coccineum]
MSVSSLTLENDIMESVISRETAKAAWTNLVHSFKDPSDTKENRIKDLKLEYQTFRSKPSKSLSQTYTRYKTLLNELSNDGVTVSKHEINVGFMSSLPEKWLSFSQRLRNANHTQTLDLVDIYGRFVYEENLISRRYPETKKALITAPSVSPVSIAIFSNNIVQDFQENSDNEADTRTSEEYLKDLELEFHERALLANSKRNKMGDTDINTLTMEQYLALTRILNPTNTSLTEDKKSAVVTDVTTADAIDKGTNQDLWIEMYWVHVRNNLQLVLEMLARVMEPVTWAHRETMLTDGCCSKALKALDQWLYGVCMCLHALSWACHHTDGMTRFKWVAGDVEEFIVGIIRPQIRREVVPLGGVVVDEVLLDRVFSLPIMTIKSIPHSYCMAFSHALVAALGKVATTPTSIEA